ncbi:MAG: Gfo/Idh/MocA family oxidoreductase [Thaumarchaeota archaeon]|nr:Gfo/Idh/MocA family oxidoreductase [Nitrososphaerota archaeon]
MKLKIGVVGVGFWGSNHVRVLRELESAEVKAVCDIDLEKAKYVAKKFGVPNYYQNLDDMLNKEELDAVTVCTPSVSHAEITVRILESGLNVFVEKPLASNPDGCLKIIDAARSNNRFVMTGFIERFNPAVSKAIELLRAGEIGEVIMSHGRRIGWWPQRIGDVGVVKDTAIHDIDLTRYIFGQEPAGVYARGGSLRHRFEDHVQAIMTFEDELRVAFIEANWLTPRKKREMLITGNEGVISIQFLTQVISLEKADVVIEPILKWKEPLRIELSHFIESLLSRKKPLVDAIDGTKAVIIAESILESMKKNRPIEIDFKRFGL